MKKTVLITATMFLFSSLAADNDNGAHKGSWQLCDTSGDIRSYIRSVPGSSYCECKGVTDINARIETVAEIIRDIESYPQWFANCRSIKIINRTSPDDIQIYFVYDAPWPVKDRDVIVQTRAEKDFVNGVARIFIDPLPDNIVPVKEEFVRMKDLSILFVLEYMEREKTRLTMIFSVDPSGSVPASLANITTRSHPYKTLSGFKKMVCLKRYEDMGLRSCDRENVERYLADKVRINGRLVKIGTGKKAAQ